MAERQTDLDQTDLILAANLQAALLPKQCPKPCPQQVLAARNRMCRSLGGDFYDFIQINDQQIALLIGDVVGHGVRAALVMASIMGFLRSEPEIRGRPLQVMKALNRLLIDLGEKTDTVMTCTIFYAVIDLPTNIAFFSNAGHPWPFICNQHTLMKVDADNRSTLLGIDKFDASEGCHQFTAGQRLVMYTDGITEATNSKGQLFGEESLAELIIQNVDYSAEQLTNAIFDDMDRFRLGTRQDDDETIVVMDCV